MLARSLSPRTSISTLIIAKFSLQRFLLHRPLDVLSSHSCPKNSDIFSFLLALNFRLNPASAALMAILGWAKETLCSRTFSLALLRCQGASP